MEVIPVAKKEKGTRQKKKKGRSTQELLGIKTFTKYGLAVGKYELLFYMIAPTNISVLSRANIEIKIHHPVSYTHLDVYKRQWKDL